MRHERRFDRKATASSTSWTAVTLRPNLSQLSVLYKLSGTKWYKIGLQVVIE